MPLPLVKPYSIPIRREVVVFRVNIVEESGEVYRSGEWRWQALPYHVDRRLRTATDQWQSDMLLTHAPTRESSEERCVKRLGRMAVNLLWITSKSVDIRPLWRLGDWLFVRKCRSTRARKTLNRPIPDRLLHFNDHEIHCFYTQISLHTALIGYGVEHALVHNLCVSIVYHP